MKLRLKKTAGRYDTDAPYQSAHVPSVPENMASQRDREELDRFHTTLDSRVDTQATLKKLFGYATTSREKERAKAKKLFTQAGVASTNSPGLQPNVLETPALESDAGQAPAVKTASMEPAYSITPRIDAWFEKNASSLLTEAQRRYPELLKVAAIPSPTLKKGKSTPAVASSLSGGSA
jgi:hypothetical protein